MMNHAVEPLNSLKNLIASLVINSDELLPLLGNVKISGARCTISESSGAAGVIKTCTLQISALCNTHNLGNSHSDVSEREQNFVGEAVQDMQSMDSYQVQVNLDTEHATNQDQASEELHNPECNLQEDDPSDSQLNMEPETAVGQQKKAKRQRKEVPRDVSLVRRSNRLAGLAAGFKNPQCAKAASSAEERIELAPQFEATVIDGEAGPPPFIPVDTLQAIGIDHFKMPPIVVNDAALNYDSSDE